MSCSCHKRTVSARIVRLAAFSIFYPCTFFASGLTSGHYHFEARYALVCLYGTYPITVNDMTTGCVLSVNIDATGALSGALDIRSIPGVATGTFTSQDNVASIHLHAVGQDVFNTESDIDAQLSGTSQFIGTATSGGESGLATLDVSAAAPLLVTFDLDITVDAQGAVTGAGMATACNVQVPVNVTGNNGPESCLLHIIGANLPSFTWDGSGPPTETGFNAAWSANGFGATASGTGLVIAASSSSLENISTRLNVGTGDNVLIAGFIITGNAPKKVLLRAIGPALSNFGLSGVLADPVLELHESDGTVVSNDNWKDTQEAEIEATTIPPTNDLESAILVTLTPADPGVPGSGAYTAIVKGNDDGTGVALVEVYDLDTGADSQLANISTRGFVQTGDDVMIAGLIVGKASEVLVRAIGPTLAQLGVPNSLADTTLELHDPDGALIASNDDWQESQQSEIEATGIPPTDDRESAILMTLQPSSYTAIVRGKNETTGVALVEAYQLGN